MIAGCSLREDTFVSSHGGWTRQSGGESMQRKHVVVEPLVYGYVEGVPYFTREAFFAAKEGSK